MISDTLSTLSHKTLFLVLKTGSGFEGLVASFNEIKEIKEGDILPLLI